MSKNVRTRKTIQQKTTKMKNKIALLLLSFCLLNAWGQKEEPKDYDKISYELYQEYFDKELSEYNCSSENGKRVKSVSDEVLQENLYGIYTSIIPNMQNLAGNTSAFTYSHNSDKNTLNVSTSFQFKKCKESFLNAGIYVEGNSGFFDLYSSNSWNNNVALTAGFSIVLSGSQYLDPKKCEELIPKRKDYADSLLLTYNVKLSRTITELENKRDDLKDVLDKLKYQFPAKEGDSIEDKIKQWQKLNKEIEEYKGLLKDNEADIKKRVVSELKKFDTKNDHLYGYNIVWLNIGSSIANSTIKISDSLVERKEHIINYPKIITNVALKWDWLGKRYLQHISFEGLFTRGSFLDDPVLLRGKEPSVNYTNGAIADVFYEGVKLGQLTDLKKPVWQYTLGAYYAGFFLFDKSLGFSVRGSLNGIAFTNNYAPSYKQNYSVLAGPVFRVAKEESWAKATFGINIGFQNVPNNAKAKDFFAVQAYIGVPFGAFLKKDKA